MFQYSDGNELRDLLLAIDHQAHRHALQRARRDPRRTFFQRWGRLVPDSRSSTRAPARVVKVAVGCSGFWIAPGWPLVISLNRIRCAGISVRFKLLIDVPSRRPRLASGRPSHSRRLAAALTPPHLLFAFDSPVDRLETVSMSTPILLFGRSIT